MPSSSSSWISTFNRLLPFATPGTPLLQDCIHLAAICLLLYYAPQIQERIQQIRTKQHVGSEAQQQAREGNGAGGNENVDDNPQHQAQFNGNNDDDNDINPNGPQDNNENGNDVNFINADNDHDPQPGPANNPPAAAAQRTTSNNGQIGAKKAKSLARRDQRRAYNEFLRAEGDAQRAQDAEGAAEREALQRTEQERRREVAAALEAKKRAERKYLRDADAVERERAIARRERIVEAVRAQLEEGGSGRCNLFAAVDDFRDEDAVEEVVKASGLLGPRKKGGHGPGDDERVILTGRGWVVRVSREEMEGLYGGFVDGSAGTTDEEGVVSYEDLGKRLEGYVSSR